MRLPRFAALTSALGVMALCGSMVSGQNYPTKTVRIVTAESGGGNDFVARVIAQGLTVNWGQQVIVDNRGGTGGARAAQTVAQASPDGYTVLFYTSTLWIAAFARHNAIRSGKGLCCDHIG